jgi:hypothetical protein
MDLFTLSRIVDPLILHSFKTTLNRATTQMEERRRARAITSFQGMARVRMEPMLSSRRISFMIWANPIVASSINRLSAGKTTTRYLLRRRLVRTSWRGYVQREIRPTSMDQCKGRSLQCIPRSERFWITPRLRRDLRAPSKPLKIWKELIIKLITSSNMKVKERNQCKNTKIYLRVSFSRLRTVRKHCKYLMDSHLTTTCLISRVCSNPRLRFIDLKATRPS